MKNSTIKCLGIILSTTSLGLTACNSGTATPAATTTTSNATNLTAASNTPECLILNINATKPDSKTKNSLLLTIQNNCSETLTLNSQALTFLSQNIARTPVNAPLKFSATNADGKKYTLAFTEVNPQTGLVRSVDKSKFTLAPQEGIMLTGNGKLNGTAYDWKTANATLQLVDQNKPIADSCLKAHIMVDNPDAKKKNVATVYVENSCNYPQSLKNKEISFLSQDFAGYPIAITKLQGTFNGASYSIALDNNDGHYYVANTLSPDFLVLPAHNGIQLSGAITLHGSKYDFFTAERTMLVRNTAPANLNACLGGHVFVSPEATTATEIQVAIQNNCDTPQAVKGNNFSFVAQDVNQNPIWVSTLVLQITSPQALTYVMNFDTLHDKENRISRTISSIDNAPELVLQPHNSFTFTGTAPLMGQPFDLQSAEQTFAVTH